ncbi:MAG: cation acetate symporter [Myxococcales bacterium]|nr:cation acetate symporter [Myxococcales bacterium]
MTTQGWTFLIVGATFALYIGIAIWSRAASTKDFYVAGGGVSPIANGMATGADWMSAASFLSMAGLIAFMGYDGSVYLMGWTGGYVLLALLLAPYLRKFGQFTVPDFVGDRYYSQAARLVAVICAIFISFTYVAGQMRGVGVVFSRFLEVDITIGVLIGMAVVFFYAVLGGMKGITYTQVAQYVVLIFAYMVPAIFISLLVTDNPIPQLGLGGEVQGGGYLLDKLDGLHAELGFAAYTDGSKSLIDVFCITMALMVGTAGLPHVIIRFYTVPRVRDARLSAGYALLFIAILYTTAPAVAAFARQNLISTVEGASYAMPEAEGGIPDWFKKYEASGLIAWLDKDGDGRIRYRAGDAFQGAPQFAEDRGPSGERRVTNPPAANENELYVDRDIMVLANPEIAHLPDWVIALVAAGALAAALSTAAGLLLVVSTAVSHDLLKRTFTPGISEKNELRAARVAAAVAVCIAGWFGIHPPGFVAQVVAFAFGLAAATFFPAIILGIFVKRANREGVVAGMIAGLLFTGGYIVWFKFLGGTADGWWLGISPEGIGTLGMCLNFAVSLGLGRFFPPPPADVQQLVEDIRVPRGAGQASAH